MLEGWRELAIPRAAQNQLKALTRREKYFILRSWRFQCFVMKIFSGLTSSGLEREKEIVERRWENIEQNISIVSEFNELWITRNYMVILKKCWRWLRWYYDILTLSWRCRFLFFLVLRVHFWKEISFSHFSFLSFLHLCWNSKKVQRCVTDLISMLLFYSLIRYPNFKFSRDLNYEIVIRN